MNYRLHKTRQYYSYPLAINICNVRLLIEKRLVESKKQALNEKQTQYPP